MLSLILSPAGFFLVIATYAAGALGALLLGKYDRPANLWGNLFAVAGSVLGIIFSGAVLVTGTFPEFSIPTSFPLLSFSFRIDYLSAFFMLLISLIALFCSIYALGYVGHFYRKYPLGEPRVLLQHVHRRHDPRGDCAPCALFSPRLGNHVPDLLFPGHL